MDKSNRPVGRQKRVGTGVGNVQRRGDGLGGRTEGPVGTPGGYSDRLEDQPFQQTNPSTDNTNDAGGSNNSNPLNTILGGLSNAGAGSQKSGSSKILTYIVIAAFIIYFLYSCYSNSKKDLAGPGNNSGNTNLQTENTNGTFDTGAYAVNTMVSNAARAKYTSLKGNGQDTATIMVYLCGSDLESQGAAATSDLQEMMYAEFTDNVNVIVETGGCSKWQNNTVKSGVNQRYRLTTEGLEPIEKDLGRKSMVNPSTLSDFIQYTAKRYPADRYFLVMWDHGGGSLTGFGYDQYFQRDSMTLDELSTALRNGNCQFDFIGFDACLMGSFETAIVLEPYADYMIASEEVEPGVGWHYNGWITALSKDTSIPTPKLGKILIDDYVKEVKSQVPEAQATLSMLDLAEFKGTIPSAFSRFASSTKGLLEEKAYQTVADARSDAKEFAASTAINQIDLINFAENIGTKDAKALVKTLKDCIKYNRSSNNITDANGLSIFFPYNKMSIRTPILEMYDEIGMDDNYSDCIRSFASVVAGGQAVSSGSNNLLESLLGTFLGGNAGSGSGSGSGGAIISQLLNSFLANGDFGSLIGLLGGSTNWLDEEKVKESVEYYKENSFDTASLKIIEKDGQKVLSLTEKQWDLIHHMEMNVFIDDGKGFIDLGLDNVYEYNDDGDLVMEYDGTWLAMNDRIVSYYLISDDRHGDTYQTRGRVPALLNNQLVDIMVVFDNENPYGKVIGAQKKYDADRETQTVAKGLLEIKAGDKIDYLCDYYTYDGKYTDTYYLGKQYTATGDWKIENISVGNRDYVMAYRITDIYDNHYWTPSVSN
ncbi:clostripain-related cysteine peptidase [bacterium]|nr:clostripain-related cysteine peptidase [bacterium]